MTVRESVYLRFTTGLLRDTFKKSNKKATATRRTPSLKTISGNPPKGTYSMAINQRLSRANSISTNEDNLVVGKLTSVDVITSEIVDQNSGETIETEQIEWVWEVPTKLGTPTRIHEWTGLNINSEKTWSNGKESSYNKLTTILIQSGLIDAKRIEQTDLETIDIESLLNREFQFELEKRSTKRNIKSIKLSTLKLLKSL